MANVAIYPTKIQGWALQITNAIGTTATTLLSAGANGSIVESLNVSLTDTTASAIQIFLQDSGAVNHLLGTVTIPLSAGNLGTAAGIDVLRSGQLPGLPVDANGDYCIYVPSGFKLVVAATAAPAATKIMDVVAMGADY